MCKMKKLRKLLKNYHIKTLNDDGYPLLNKFKAAYKNKYQIPHYSFVYRDKMKPEIGMLIADAFEGGIDTPNHPLAKAAYEQMIKEVLNQYYFVQEHLNIDFEPYEEEGEPYANSMEMVKDVYNQHMYFFTTQNGFGEKAANIENPMLRKTGNFVHGYELLVNDIFRIVHDIFGHATYGYSFGPVGEDWAWITHSSMFTPLARAAITTETRGQNCWVNFGKHLRNRRGRLYDSDEDGWMAPAERPFAEQKIMLLPKEISGVEVVEKNGKIEASPLPNWDPFMSLVIAYIDRSCRIC